MHAASQGKSYPPSAQSKKYQLPTEFLVSPSLLKNTDSSHSFHFGQIEECSGLEGSEVKRGPFQ